MPSLGGAVAEPLRFLDFLIHEPVRAVLLYKGGIPVLVPELCAICGSQTDREFEAQAWNG